MFEVLLQADKALASGALDQAERSYWQLIELDPTNAIAVAGLARVSLERGDQRLARTLAERALAIDPDSFAAKRIIETLEGRGGKAPASDEPDLPLLAAQRLEAIGRRRRTGDEDADEETREQLSQLPSEPLKERRQAGRKAAAATAAAAEAAAAAGAEAAPGPAPRIPKRPALGDRTRRHLLEPPKLPHRIDDPFAVAESAAAIEAVDQLDEVGDTGPAATDDLGQVLGAIGAADEDEGISMRVALISDAARLEAAELEATLGAIEAMELEAAEGEAAEGEAAEGEAAEGEAAEPIESISPARAEVEFRTSEPAAADVEADFEAAEIKASGAPVERPTRPSPRPATAEEATEEDAEAFALREALAVVLGTDVGGAPTEDGERARHGAEGAASQPSADDAGDEPPAQGSDGGGDAAGSEATPQRRRQGLLRRFLGN